MCVIACVQHIYIIHKGSMVLGFLLNLGAALAFKASSLLYHSSRVQEPWGTVNR